MPKVAQVAHRSPTRNVPTLSTIELKDGEVTRRIYSAAVRMFRETSTPGYNVSVRLRSGVVKTVRALAVNEHHESAGKGWPTIYIVEPEKQHVMLCVLERGGTVLSSLNWDDLMGRNEFKDDEKARRNRADLVYYIEGLFGLR